MLSVTPGGDRAEGQLVLPAQAGPPANIVPKRLQAVDLPSQRLHQTPRALGSEEPAGDERDRRTATQHGVILKDDRIPADGSRVHLPVHERKAPRPKGKLSRQCRADHHREHSPAGSVKCDECPSDRWMQGDRSKHRADQNSLSRPV